MMIKHVVSMLLFAFLLLKPASLLLAQSPDLINYQGRLLDGTNLVNGAVDLSLRLYTASSGGVQVYEDAGTVTLVDGLYETFLGDDTVSGSLVSALTNNQVWLEVEVDGVTLAPRERLVSVPYALATRGLLVTTNLDPSVVVAGGLHALSNEVNGAAIVGGDGSSIATQADYAAIIGGRGNQIRTTGQRSAILGGQHHVVGLSAPDNALVGGFTNVIDSNARANVIAGGQGNRVGNSGFGGFIAAGTSNAVAGRGSFAGGNRAKATNSQSFVWADGTAADFGTTTSNQFLIRAAGGVGIGTNVTEPNGLTVAGAVAAASFSGSGSGITNLGSASLADGAITAEKLAADSVTAGAIADGAVSVDKLNADQMAVRLLTHISNPATVSTGSHADQLGYSVARVGGDRILVGMPGDDTASFLDTGSVHLFNRDGSLITSITNPLPTTGARFGYTVAGISTTHFVVASLGGSVFPRTNEVYVFNANGSLLNRVVIPETGADADWSTSIIGLGSDRFVIGQPFHVSNGTFVGIARMFNTSGILLATITNPAPGIEDLFGNALAAVGTNRFVVGNWLDDAGASDAGAAYLYTMDGTLVATITNPVPEANAQFGASVAGVGTDGFAIGAYGQDRVYLYNNNGVLQRTITNAGGTSAGFGATVAGLGTNEVLINDFNDEPGGVVYVYDLDGELLATIPDPSGSAGRFGSAMTDIGAGRWAISDQDTEGRVIRAGSVFLYDAVMTVSGLVAESSATLLCTLDTSKFSAYADLAEEGYLDANNTGDLMTRFFADQRYINTNDTLDAPVGSASSPTYGFSGDSNTGIFQPAADQVAVSAGGVVRLLVNESGSVGIGTTNPAPTVPLHVFAGSAGTLGTFNTKILIEDDNDATLQFLAPTNAFTGLVFSQPGNTIDASIRYNHNNNRELLFRVGDNASRMIILTNGFVGIGTTTPTNRLHVNGTVQATAYITGSDRNMKENIQPVDPAVILDKVAALPIATWSFKEEANGTHIGPMAQDFHAAFGFGNTDSGIMTVDADGVALAAIQALAQEKTAVRGQVSEVRDRVSELEEENALLRQELEAIKRKLGM
jgi:hypothetical protein